MSVMHIREEEETAVDVYIDDATEKESDKKKKKDRDDFHFNYDVKFALMKAGYKVKKDKPKGGLFKHENNN